MNIVADIYMIYNLYLYINADLNLTKEWFKIADDYKIQI